MAWELGPYFLERGQTARHVFAWTDGNYRGIQMVHAKPETWGTGGWLLILGATAELAVTEHSVAFDPETERYTYTVDVTARHGNWYQYRLRGQGVG